MTFDEYQERAHSTAVYPPEMALPYSALGLCGEAGEYANKVKKILRGDYKIDKDALAKELGGVLWYLAECCTVLGLSLSEVAELNILQLASRKERGTLKGDGDER